MNIELETELKRGTYEVDRLLIDRQGNILKYIYEPDDVKIKTPKDKENDNYKRYLKMIDDRDEFSWLIADECGSFYFNFFNGGLDSMDIKESIKLRFLYLCTYTNYSDRGQYIVYDNGKKMDRGGLVDVLALSDRELSVTITTLIKNGLLIKDGRHYMVNKDLIARGTLTKSQNKDYHTRIFDNGLRELYNNCSAKQHKQLYYLFKLLPYVNIKYNAICQNPTETIVEDVIPLKLSEICEIIGYSVPNAKKFEKDMLKLQLFNQYAMLGIINGSGTWYKINPRVLYSGIDSHLDELKNLLSTDFSISK